MRRWGFDYLVANILNALRIALVKGLGIERLKPLKLLKMARVKKT